MWLRFVFLLVLLGPSAARAQEPATLQIEVRFDSAPVSDATIVVNGTTQTTPAAGAVAVNVPEGAVEITAVKEGFLPITTTLTAKAGETRRVVIELQKPL